MDWEGEEMTPEEKAVNNEDVLLAAVMRKIIASENYHCVIISEDRITLDSTWTIEEDGLAQEELQVLLAIAKESWPPPAPTPKLRWLGQ